MSRKPLLLLLFLSVLLLFQTALPAQYFSQKIKLGDPDQVHILQTHRGDRFVGQLKTINSTTLQFQLHNGNLLPFEFQEVLWVITWEEEEKSIQANLKQQRKTNGKGFVEAYSFINPQSLIYSSTAFNFEKGQGEYRNLEVLWNAIDIGLSDHFSVGGGIIFPGIWLVRAKATLDAGEYIHLGIGTNMFLSFFEENANFNSAHTYLAVSVGEREKFFNLTAGYFLPFDKNETPVFLLSLGGAYQIAPRWRLHFEVFLDDVENLVLPGFGGVWQRRKFRLEFGLAGIPAGVPVLFPIIGTGILF